MKVLLLTFVLILPSTYVIAQKTPEWYRVYTFDESIIEMNTSSVIVGGDIGRVTFRWTFDQPETVKGNPQLKYKSRLETIEFKCADGRYRYYEVSLLDSTGKTIHSQLMSPPYEWHEIKSESVMATISGPACQLIQEKMDPEGTKRNLDEANESDRVVMFARSIKDALEQSRDFKPLVEKFFVAGFVKRYLADKDTNWFYNLNRDTAEKASPAELQRFYVASLNAGYLTSLYLVSQSPSEDDSTQEGSASEAKMIPNEVYQLINNHSYTLTYKGKEGGYDYLAENIDSIARMRSYTDLLEKIAVLMRKHVVGVQAERSQQYRQMLEEDSDVKSRICPSECLGLPKGTKLFDMYVPLLRLQFAEIKGELKIVSARDSSH
jgi:hypothetical protein